MTRVDPVVGIVGRRRALAPWLESEPTARNPFRAVLDQISKSLTSAPGVARLVLIAVTATLVATLTVTTASTAAPSRVEHRCQAASMHVIYKKQHRCLNLGTRKLIYQELAHYQDIHPGQDLKAYVVVAKRWRVPEKAAWKIAYEGASKNWPLPPLPDE